MKLINIATNWRILRVESIFLKVVEERFGNMEYLLRNIVERNILGGKNAANGIGKMASVLQTKNGHMWLKIKL